MKKTRLKNLKINESSLVDKGANQMAFVTLFKRDDEVSKQMKTENGIEHPASHFAYVPDKEKPSTWKLRLYDDKGEMTPKQVGMAVAALGVGFRGQKVDIPAEDLSKVKAKVKAAWKKMNPDATEVPEILKVDSIFNKMKDFLFGIHKDMDQAVTVDYAMETSNARSEWWTLTCAFETSIMSILQDPLADQSTMLTQSCMQFIEHAKQLSPYLQDMYKAEGAFTALEAICEDVSKAGKQISTANMDRIKEAMRVLHETLGMDMTQFDAMYGEKKPNPDMSMKKSGIDDKNIKKGDDLLMDYQEILKSLPADQVQAIQTEIEKAIKEAIIKAQPDNEIKKQLDEVSKANVELVKALEVERDIRITKDFITKAENYKGIPVKAEDFGKLLKEISKKAPEQYDELIKTLDAANELITKNNTLMKEIGGNDPVESDAVNKMNIKAVEIQKANTGMTFETAFAKAIRENPGLYDEYQNQKK